jgi:hypothetical protein
MNVYGDSPNLRRVALERAIESYKYVALKDISVSDAILQMAEKYTRFLVKPVEEDNIKG